MSLPTLRLFDGYQHTSTSLRPHVKQLQEELKKEGYQIVCDGYFGQGTEALVKQFQSEKGIMADGIVGPVTWNALLNDFIISETDVFATTYKLDNADMKKQNKEASKYKNEIIKNSKKYDIPVAVICGIGSRESSWGLMLKPVGPQGTGDFIKRRFPAKYRDVALPSDGGGYGRGLMQIDFDAHEFARTGKWQDPIENIKFGCSVFFDCRNYVSKKSNLAGLNLIRASLAAYNCGPSRVMQALSDNLDFDYFTAGRDYSKDALNRAGYFQLAGW